MSRFGNALTEYSPQMEAFEYEGERESNPVFGEQQEMELAAEFLEIASEQELENFLGGLVDMAGNALGGLVRSPLGKSLGGALKGVARQALPIAGGALGTFVGGPVGTAIGSTLGSMAGQALGLELEGLSAEDREFETARSFVRLAGDAVKNALSAPPGTDPALVARTAVADAMRVHAPAALDAVMPSDNRSGRWINHQPKERAMHDIDRIQVGREMETYEYPGGGATGRVFNEQQEWELASELLEIGSEQEFEQFLGDLISKAGRAAGSFISSPTGQAIGGVLKSAAGQLLPMAGSAIGGYFGGPTGAQIGGRLAQAAGGMFGLEAESEEREWEAATTFVRLAGDTVKNAANAPQGANPVAVAQAALSQAAQVHAPGLVAPPEATAGPYGGGGSPMGGGRSGRWVRRGGKIVLFGA